MVEEEFRPEFFLQVVCLLVELLYVCCVLQPSLHLPQDPLSKLQQLLEEPQLQLIENWFQPSNLSRFHLIDINTN